MADNDNSLIYWLGGGLLVVLVLVALSFWTPIKRGPEDVAPAAGPSYATDTKSQQGPTADEMKKSGPVNSTPTYNTPTYNAPTNDTPVNNPK